MGKKNKSDFWVTKEEVKEELMMEEKVEQVEDKLDFDAWYAIREKKIPRQHRKEILKADFKGRGLSMLETMSKYDAALKKYGVNLE